MKELSAPLAEKVRSSLFQLPAFTSYFTVTQPVSSV